MKKAKIFFFSILFLAFISISTSAVNASSSVGVSVYMDALSQVFSEEQLKLTNSYQKFEPTYVFNNRKVAATLFTYNPNNNTVGSTSYNWETISNGSILANAYFNEGLQAQANTYYKMKFKPLAVYLTGTSIAGIWIYDI